jgi:hypothetical protein
MSALWNDAPRRPDRALESGNVLPHSQISSPRIFFATLRKIFGRNG